MSGPGGAQTTTTTTYILGHDEQTTTQVSGQQATAVATRYYPTPGGALAVRDATGLSYLATDHLGAPIATVNLDTGALLGEQLRAPYGEARYGVQANNPSGGMHTTFGFTGQREDQSGLSFFNARYYDAAVGRFVSADTSIDADPLLDGYAYVGGMVESATDPSGHVRAETVEAGSGANGLEGESSDDLADGSGDGISNGTTIPPAFQNAFEGDPADALDPNVTATSTEGDTTTTYSGAGEGDIEANTQTVTKSGTTYATSWLRVGQAGFSAAQQQLHDDILGVTSRNKAAYLTYTSSASTPSGTGGNGGGTGSGTGAGTGAGTNSGTSAGTGGTTNSGGVGQPPQGPPRPPSVGPSGDDDEFYDGQAQKDRLRGRDAKREDKNVNKIASRFKMTSEQRRGFGLYIHDLKYDEGRGGDDNFTWEQLMQFARDYLDENGD